MQYLNLCMHVYMYVFVVYFKSNKSFLFCFVYLLLIMTTLSYSKFSEVMNITLSLYRGKHVSFLLVRINLGSLVFSIQFLFYLLVVGAMKDQSYSYLSLISFTLLFH